jgi:FlaG/FlaF family flagellin (archaellin)
MVAITVILAAVIAAFVFCMAGNISKTKVVAATAQQQGTAIFITYQGGQDHASVTGITAVVGDDAVTFNHGHTVGSTARYSEGTGEKDHVVVTATFTDNSQQVILDTYV